MSLSLGPQQVAPTRFLYLAAVLPHTIGNIEMAITRCEMGYKLRTVRSGCHLCVPNLQLAARSSSCSPNFIPNRVPARSCALAILGNLETLRIAPALVRLRIRCAS